MTNNEKNTLMDNMETNMDKVKSVLRDGYLKYGSDLFLDQRRLSSFMDDILFEYPNEKKRLKLAVNDNIVLKLIHDVDVEHINKARLYIKSLIDSYFIPEELAQEIVYTFIYAIYGIDESVLKKSSSECLIDTKDVYEELTKQQIASADDMFEKGLKEDAFKQYLNIAENNKVPAAMWRAAKCLHHGWGVVKNEDKAKQFFIEACQNNYSDAIYYVATAYVKDEKKRFEMLKKLADEQAHPGACYTLGQLYAKGVGCKQDNNIAFEMTRIAAEKNHYFAMIALSSMYLMGTGVRQSDEKAREWQKKSEMVSKTTEKIFIEKIKKEFECSNVAKS